MFIFKEVAMNFKPIDNAFHNVKFMLMEQHDCRINEAVDQKIVINEFINIVSDYVKELETNFADDDIDSIIKNIEECNQFIDQHIEKVNNELNEKVERGKDRNLPSLTQLMEDFKDKLQGYNNRDLLNFRINNEEKIEEVEHKKDQLTGLIANKTDNITDKPIYNSIVVIEDRIEDMKGTNLKNENQINENIKYIGQEINKLLKGEKYSNVPEEKKSAKHPALFESGVSEKITKFLKEIKEMINSIDLTNIARQQNVPGK